MHNLSAMKYSPALDDLIESAELNPLGPGRPNNSVRSSLERLKPEDIAGASALVDRDMGDACIAGLWLLHNFLDESHEISQKLENPTGSFWHGVMHRREEDYSNAKYWFCRVGVHPIYSELGGAAKELAESNDDQKAAFLREQHLWDPNRFIDLCKGANGRNSDLEMLCRRIQRLEWDLLFNYCYRRAAGDAAST